MKCVFWTLAFLAAGWALYLWPLVALVAAAWLLSLVLVGALAWGYGVYYVITHAVESEVRVVRIQASKDALAHAERLAKLPQARTQ